MPEEKEKRKITAKELLQRESYQGENALTEKKYYEHKGSASTITLIE